MGVSLERVQFRFASIIGELCSEPIILSQFAVWVDLKMAEYKAKGAMSLECSGDKPKPSWMKGVIPLENAVLLENSIPRKGIGVENNDDFRQEDWAYGQATDSNPEEIMLIKEEVRSPSQTESTRAFYTDGTNSRKRHSQEHHPHSSKQRRTGSYSQSPITTQNESLLSVIGGAVDENDEARVTELVNRLIPASYSSTPTTSTTVDDMSTGNQQIPDLSFTIQESTSNNDKWSEGPQVASSSGSPVASQLYKEIPSEIPNQAAGYSCMVCSYQTPKAYNMKRHVSTHMPDLKIKCPICNRGFIDRYQLMVHTKRKHKEIYSNVNEDVVQVPDHSDCVPLT